MSDVLKQLKEQLVQGFHIQLQDASGFAVDDILSAESVGFLDKDNKQVDSLKFNMAEDTKFTMDGKPLQLRTIIHCYLNRDMSVAEYLSDCQSKKLTNISFLQRNDLIKWLNNEVETSQYIVDDAADLKGKQLEKSTEQIENDLSTSIEKGETPSAKAGINTVDGTSITTTTDKDKIKLSSKSLTKDDPILAKTLHDERYLVDHNSSLRGSKPVNFGYLIKDVELKLVQSIKASLRNKDSSKGRVSKQINGTNGNGISHDQRKSNSIQRKDPIILIPSATSSILTMSNIKQFLQDSNYINPRELSISMGTDLITIEKKFNKINRPIKFIVVNNTRMFTKPEYWDRVVAVFTTGHEWQFNNYQWSKPQDLFKRCKGYYFHFNTDEVPKNVKQWNVEPIPVDKNVRFRDLEIVRSFWLSLESELISRGFH